MNAKQIGQVDTNYRLSVDPGKLLVQFGNGDQNEVQRLTGYETID